MKNFCVILAAVAVVVLPFIFRQTPEAGDWEEGDPELIVVTAHNEAFRREFAEGFSDWHRERYGAPVRIDWRIIGGTTEIMRYLAAEYVSSARRHFIGLGLSWPADGATAVLAAKKPEAEDRGALWERFRASDNPDEITSRIDLLFGGGMYDHARAQNQGLTVPAWGEAGPPPGIFEDEQGRVLIPRELNGEVWYDEAYYGCVLSAFGICYNVERLADLGINKHPEAWCDLADPRYFGTLGLADPSKSASVAKAYEMVIHEQCAKTVSAAGFTRAQIREFERLIKAGGDSAGSVPDTYQAAVERGWLNGINLIRRIGANARYFSDASGKVPVDVSTGAAAAGIAIDFFGRLQSEMSTPPGCEPVMRYITPVGGSGVNSDPISLLRGAPHRELAVRFIEFTLGEAGQRLWNYRVGEPGGPRRFNLRRLPIRRDFYPSDDPVLQASFERHRAHLADPLWEAWSDAYRLGESFVYEARWTGRHFSVQRDLIRAMCMDSGDELRRAWQAILAAGGPEANPAAMRLLEAMPDQPRQLDWSSAVEIYAAVPRLELLRDWTAFFRRQYRLAEKAVSP